MYCSNFRLFKRAGRVILSNYLNKDRFSAILDSAYFNKGILSDDVIDGYYDRAIRTGWEQSLLAMVRDMPQNVIDFPLDTLTYPTLIIHGDNDSWVSQDNLDLWRNEIPDAVFYLMADAGHVPMEEQPAVFNQSFWLFCAASTNINEPAVTGLTPVAAASFSTILLHTTSR
jgi:pimeloyl-ACP methyl ester carboxylesterase